MGEGGTIAELGAMWLLLIISLTGGFADTELNRYATLAGCQTERNRVNKEMTISYPRDTSFAIVCHWQIGAKMVV